MAFQRVVFGRGGRKLFDALSVDLHERRIGIIGDNGSGKSTLLRLANGLLLPDAGRVLVDGRSTADFRNELRSEIGFVFQNPDHQIIFPTVGEEIAFGLGERGFVEKEAQARALDLLLAHGCGGWEHRAVHELSEGQKQLVCILAVLVTEPSVVLLDEPFSNLDLTTRLGLSARLAALPQRLIMASHDLCLLTGFERVIWLDEGRIRADGEPAEVLDLYREHARAHAAQTAGRA